MPATITGNPSAITPGQDVVLSAPLDGEQALAEGISGPFQVIANFLKYLVNFVATIFNTGHEWTGLHVFHSSLDMLESLRATNSTGGPALHVDVGSTIVQDLTASSLKVSGQIAMNVQVRGDRPQSGAVGDIWFGGPGSYFLWLCITAGTPGVWVKVQLA